MNPRRQSVSAFSLTELLVVIAIIAILAGAGVMALGGAGGRSPQGAATVASSVFNLARTEAIMRGDDTLVVIDTTPSSTNYLRHMSVADTSGKLLATWTTLPATAYFNTNLSTPSGSTNLQVPGTYAYYKFKFNGQLDHASGSAQFVVSPGSIVGGAFQETGTNKRYGFKIHKMGKLTFFDDPASIQ